MDFEEFFASYAAAFDAFDPEAIAGLYNYPSLLASSERANAFLSQADATARFRQVCDHHRRIGYHRAEPSHIVGEAMGDNLWKVRVSWRFLTRSGGELLAFDCTYSMADYGEGPKVVFALVHD